MSHTYHAPRRPVVQAVPLPVVVAPPVVEPTFKTVACPKCRTTLPLDPPRRRGEQVTCGICQMVLTITGSLAARERVRDQTSLAWAIGCGIVGGVCAMAFGALLGTLIFPVVGTIIGAVFCGGLGAQGGGMVGTLIGRTIARRP